MKNYRLLKQSLLILFHLQCFASFSQQINYVNGFQTNINHTSCNVFNVSPLSVVNGFAHYPLSGGATRATSAPLSLQAVSGSTVSGLTAAKGVAYAFSYTIKQGFTYSASVNALRSPVSGTTGQVSFEMGAIVNYPDPNQVNILPTSCFSVPLDNLSSLLPNRIGNGITINSNSAANYTVFQNWEANTNRNYFTVWVYGPYSTSGTNIGSIVNILINNITITETHPFSVSTSPNSFTCGSINSQTFTVNNANNAPGVTNYTWNLGNNNGWLYNGIPAPQSINSGTTNTLTLTPAAC